MTYNHHHHHRSTCRQQALGGRCYMESATSSSSVAAVAAELEKLRCLPSHTGFVQFPPACRDLLLSLPGNLHCADCNAPHPEWTSISYGILLCVQCCGRHRSYGVRNTRVKSIDMDAWSHDQILTMLEGGNAQLQQFFERHQMMTGDMTCRRYKTKAALFYRTHLNQHVEDVASEGIPYEGREATRQRAIARSSLKQLNNNNNNTEPATAETPEESATSTTPMPQQQGIAAN